MNFPPRCSSRGEVHKTLGSFQILEQAVDACRCTYAKSFLARGSEKALYQQNTSSYAPPWGESGRVFGKVLRSRVLLGDGKVAFASYKLAVPRPTSFIYGYILWYVNIVRTSFGEVGVCWSSGEGDAEADRGCPALVRRKCEDDSPVLAPLAATTARAVYNTAGIVRTQISTAINQRKKSYILFSKKSKQKNPPILLAPSSFPFLHFCESK